MITASSYQAFSPRLPKAVPMANLINHRVLLGVAAGFVLGFLLHLTTTPAQYNAAYRATYNFWKQKDDDGFEESFEDDEETGGGDVMMPEVELDVLERVREMSGCMDADLRPSIKQRGDFWVLYNYVKAEKEFRCFETITYTTIGDYTFLDNLVPLVERWKGPISVALNAPGDDFHATIDSIAYLRNCDTPIVRKYVTFHVFFQAEHTPMQVERMKTYYENQESTFDCSVTAPYINASRNLMYKTRMNLTYPINVARNIARETVQTHFIFASDIELYPTRNLIPNFLEMVAKNERNLFTDNQNKVFVLPIYEIEADQEVPENKTQLQEMYENKKAFLFHGKLCAPCHSVPKQDEWMKEPESTGLRVFSETRRLGKFSKWEAFYIGTNAEPLFDERLSWEGQSNKMTQGFAMCLLDYNYMVLDNAFIIHKPGIKKKKVQMQIHTDIIAYTQKLIRTSIKPQLEILYGKRRGCFV